MEGADNVRLADKKETVSHFTGQTWKLGNIQNEIIKPEEEKPKTENAASDSINPENAVQRWQSEDPTLEKARALAREPKQQEEKNQKQLSITDRACYIASGYQRSATVKILNLWNSWYFL